MGAAAHDAIGTVMLATLPEETAAVAKALASTLLHIWRGSELQVGTRVVPWAHFGSAVSGDKVVGDEVPTPPLGSNWPLRIGIGMEAVGVGIASYRGSSGLLIVNAVSDFAGSHKGDDWRAYVAEAAARFAVGVLARLPSLEPTPALSDPCDAQEELPGEGEAARLPAAGQLAGRG